MTSLITFFVNIGPQLAAKIGKQSRVPTSYLTNKQVNSIMLTPVTYEEVMKLINTSKNSAPGYDEVKIKPLQAANSIIAVPLAHIINLSVMNGVFPDMLKIANVVPLFKKEDSMLFSNYRPVSLLCTRSKVLEKIMYNRVIDFLNEHEILFKYQFGFLKSYSSYLVDTVDHDILLSKLHHYWISGNSFKLVEKLSEK